MMQHILQASAGHAGGNISRFKEPALKFQQHLLAKKKIASVNLFSDVPNEITFFLIIFL